VAVVIITNDLNAPTTGLINSLVRRTPHYRVTQKVSHYQMIKKSCLIVLKPVS